MARRPDSRAETSYQEIDCPDCLGSGHTLLDPAHPDAQPCPRCAGTGLIESAVPKETVIARKAAVLHLERAKAGLSASFALAEDSEPGHREWEQATLGVQASAANALIAIAEALVQ